MTFKFIKFIGYTIIIIGLIIACCVAYYQFILRLIYFVAPNAVSSEMNKLIALITTVISASNLCSRKQN